MIDAVLAEFLLQNIYLACLAMVLAGMTAYLWSRPGDSTQIDVGETVRRINSDNALVVDLRSRKEFDQGFIPGARHVEAGDIEAKAAELAKKRPLVLVCANGAVSANHARKLAGDGLERVATLKGGMRAWREASQPTHKGGKK